jgi:signal transduction histidine kinase
MFNAIIPGFQFFQSNESAGGAPQTLNPSHKILLSLLAGRDILNLMTESFQTGEKFNNDYLPLLFGVTQALSGHLEINDLFGRILSLAPDLKANFAALLLQEGDETIYYRSTQPGREELTGPVGRRFAQRLINDGLEGWVLRQQQTALVANTQQDSRWFRAPYLPDSAHSAIVLPFTLARVEAKGVYVLEHQQPGSFSPTDMPLFKAVITQISLAIENAILFKNQSERSMQLALINEVSQAATSILNLDAMLRTVVQAVRRSFGFDSVSIHLYNPATQLVELRARDSQRRYNLAPAGLAEAHQLDQGLIGWAAAANKTIVANDVTQEARYIRRKHNKTVRAELCTPITLGTKSIGVLDIQSSQLEAFNKYHVAALETLADQLAIAIENARLYDEINQHLTQLKSLNDIGQAINSTLDLPIILTLITGYTIRLMNVAAASVALRDDPANEVWFAAASGEGSEAVIGLRMALGQGLAGWVAQQGESVIVPDVYTDDRFFPEIDKNSGFRTHSILCVPLQTKGRTIGAIEVMNKQSGSFGKDDLTLLQALAAQAATAIENARLYKEQAQTIERLAQTQSQLIQSAKLAGLGELSAGIAHEINNPLATIIGLTSLLLDADGAGDAQERQEDLAMINQEARRARDIVRGLLNFARADTPHRQPTDLNQLVEESILLVYTSTVSQKIELFKGLNPLPQMFLDVNQIKQVLVNLLNNAIQAMLDQPGQPAVLAITTSLNTLGGSQPAQAAKRKGAGSTKKDEPGSSNDNGLGQPPINLSSLTDSEPTVICTISDTGPGINPEHLDKIFDPFFTTKEVGQGTGLGLSISYGIIEKHGGRIKVDSTPGQGAVFTLILPLTVPP